MADLDDFFAKRDKKRPKGKKFATADDAALALEVNARERKKNESKSNYVMPLNESGEQPPPINEYRQHDEDDEWKEQVEHQPDFSNLKIQELILDDDDEYEGKESEGRIDIDNDAKEGPWNKVKGKDDKSDSQNLSDEKSAEKPADKTPKAEDDQVTTDKPAEEPSTAATTTKTGGYVPPNRRKEAEAASKLPPEPSKPSSSSSSDVPKGAYIPPSKRGVTASSSSVSGAGVRSKKPTSAPNIDNEESFPSLGGS